MSTIIGTLVQLTLIAIALYMIRNNNNRPKGGY